MKTKKTSNELTAEAFEALRQGEVMAIVLDDVLPLEECRVAARKLRVLTQASSYLWSKDFTILGVSVGEAHEGAEHLERYLASATSTPQTARDVVFNGITPVDRITHRMMEVWSPGVRIPRKNGRPFLNQVLRRWKKGGGANPHIDQANTPLLSEFGMSRRYGVNVYVDMPTEGGAIEFWDLCMSDADYVKNKRKDYGLDRTFLGEADLKMRPKIGQAVIFDASKPHAVEAVGGTGERVTNAAFYAISSVEHALYQFA